MGGDTMKFFHFGKDGGRESTVWGFWLAEIKSLFSIAVLKFVGRSREAFHNHAFNSLSWVLKGQLTEQHYDGTVEVHRPSLKPIITRRSTFHKVDSDGETLVFTIRGPWADLWHEYVPGRGYVALTHGRKEVSL